ncbi:MAG: membrane protein insertase YidC [Bacteroidales bacterium]|nr:membrane protein insertase YidC [Bacteroidales bacterium]
MNIIGLALIGLILIGFSWYNTKQFEQQRQYQLQQDSIAAVRAFEYAQELAEQQANQAQTEVNEVSALPQTEEAQYQSTYKNPYLEAAYQKESQILRLENNKLAVALSTRGAQFESVVIKDYFTYDSLALELVKPDQSNFNIRFYSDQMLSSADFTFTPVAVNDSTALLRLYFDEQAYVEYAYTLPQDSYMVDFDVKLVGMDRFVPRNATFFDVNWDVTIPRLEQGYENEKNYSTLAFKYPNEKGVENLGQRKPSAEKKITTRMEWVGFQQQFFSAIMVAEQGFEGGDLAFRFLGENDPQRNLMECKAHMQVETEHSAAVTLPFEFYFGPNLYKELKSHDRSFEKIIPMGRNIVAFINRFAIIPMFDFFSRFIGNFGIIILLMTIVLKVVISPLTLKSYMSTAKMNVLKPEIDRINAKYPKQEDAMKKQQELMDLYQRSGVSMMGGCLPMLLQFPILIAMFRFFPVSFELRQQSFLWASDLSTYDSILDLPFKIPMYGDHVSLFALLMAITMFFYSKMNSKQMASNPQMAGMNFMTVYFMPIFMLIFCNTLSSALSYYYMLSNLLTMLQTWVIRRFFVDEQKILAQINTRAAAPKKKSKFQQRLEEMQKQQQQMLKEQQKNQRR